MKGINLSRVLLGGLLVGIFLNVGEMILHRAVLAKSWDNYLNSPITLCTSIWMVAALFILGIFIVWTYTVFRPRFGPGISTAVLTGITIWIFVCLFPSIQALALGYLPKNIVITVLIWRLFEFPIAIHAGAAPYKEGK